MKLAFVMSWPQAVKQTGMAQLPDRGYERRTQNDAPSDRAEGYA